MNRLTTAVLATIVFGLPASASHFASKPGVYDASHERIEFPKRTLHITYAKPVSPKTPVLVVFATAIRRRCDSTTSRPGTPASMAAASKSSPISMTP